MDNRPARPFRVLMLSWEFPPQVIGGLGRHVQGLSRALARAGHEVTVLTRAAPGTPAVDHVDGVRILRPLPEETADGLSAWTGAVTHPLARDAIKLITSADAALGSTAPYDVVHAHDWLVGTTAVALSRHLGASLVATIHTTESRRHQRRLPAQVDASVHAVECRLGQEARRVVVCSQYMRREIVDLLGLPPERVEVVPDGADPGAWQASPDEITAARLRFAGAGQLLGYAGRLVPEKGVQDLLTALPRLRQRHPGLRAVIAGDGPNRAELRRLARPLRLERAVSFTGFLDQPRLRAVLGACDAVVLPSRYEPSGMIALEVAAAGVPLAVAGTGGLTEFVEPGRTGVTFPPADPDGLAEAVDQLLDDTDGARRMAVRARETVLAGYTWAACAVRTARVYEGATSDRGPTLAPDFVPASFATARA